MGEHAEDFSKHLQKHIKILDLNMIKYQKPTDSKPGKPSTDTQALTNFLDLIKSTSRDAVT
jgi:hypothetical protein